jgi:germination protein YpeB
MAGILLLLGFVVKFDNDRLGYQKQLENSYMYAIQELTSQMNAITVNLQKAGYAGTPAQIGAISAKVWRDAGTAKSAMSSLPVYEMNLDSTYRFLSQVGDYAMYLSKKSANGQTFSAKERDDFNVLVDYASTLSGQLADIERVVSTGQVNVSEYLKAQSLADEEIPEDIPGIGFKDMEDGFEGYPTLIYDGPFSDNLMKKMPELTKSKPEVNREIARETAAKYAGISARVLADGPDEESHMPSYIFKNDGNQIGVTKSGGYVTYFIASRPIAEKNLTTAEARRKGTAYLTHMGIAGMRETYYEVANGVCTINFAYAWDNIVCYTDLIKVGVAMDDGSVVIYDARGYISNHKERDLGEAEIDLSTARQSLGSALKVKKSQMALIPTDGKNEVLAYEFLCEGRGEQQVLVYVNARTGDEEQILMLVENENGVLTI